MNAFIYYELMDARHFSLPVIRPLKEVFHMRILIINPNSDQNTEALLQRTAEHFLQERAAAETISITSAPRLIVTYADQAASVPELIKLFRQRGDQYDAFVLACHGDPGIDVLIAYRHFSMSEFLSAHLISQLLPFIKNRNSPQIRRCRQIRIKFFILAAAPAAAYGLLSRFYHNCFHLIMANIDIINILVIIFVSHHLQSLHVFQHFSYSAAL